jgi:hypothetical protein
MAETYDAKIFQRDGVAMVLYPDGDEAVLADVMRYMNPGMEYDQATGEALYAAPPPAEAGADWKPAQPYDMPSSGLLASQPEDQGSATGFPELDRMLTGLGNINQMLNPVEGIGQSMDASRRMLAPDTAGWDRVSALGDMLSGVAGVAAPVAAAARAGTPAAMALMEGLLGWSPTSAAAKDTAKSIARTVAERANQRGPVPVMGSNLANLLGDTLPAPRNEAEAIAKNILELRATGNVDAVTESMMNAADPQYMYNYTPLPMDKASRMARAGDIGFPKEDWYHGTNQDIGGFQGNVFTADNPTLASTYARGITDAQTYPLLLRSKLSTTPVDAGGRLWSQIPIQAIDDPAVASWLDPNALQSTRSIEAAAVKEGRSGVRFKDVLDIGPGFDSQQFKRAGYSPAEIEAMRLDYLRQLDTPATVDVRLAPNQVRSRFARFDPMFSHLRNLSAGVAISPLAYGLLSDQYARENRE